MKYNNAEDNLFKAFEQYCSAVSLVDKARAYLKLMRALRTWAAFWGGKQTEIVNYLDKLEAENSKPVKGGAQ